MSIIEVQMRTDRFCELVRGEINSQPLDKPTHDELTEIAGKNLERIDCTSCVLNENLTGEGRVVVDANLAFEYHSSLASVRAAGSLKPATPAKKDYLFRLRFWMTIETTPVRRPVLSYELLALGIVSAKKATFPISVPSDLPVIAAAIVADANVVAIRLGTAADDPVDAAPVDRTSGQEWIQLVPGDLIADMIRRILDRTLDAAVVPPPPPDPNKPWLPKPKPQELLKDGAASAIWMPIASPYVAASGEIVAVDACPVFDVDISIELSLLVTFEFPNPGTMKTRAVLTWDADSTWCDILSTLAFGFPVGIGFHIGAENEVSETILGKHIAPGDGFVEAGRTDDSITYERLAGSPPPPSAEFVTTHAEATGEGLAVGGDIRPKVRASLVGHAIAPMPEVAINCNLRSVSLVMSPAQVFLRTDKPPQLPWFFFEKIVFDPPGAWVFEVDTEIVSPASSSSAHVVLTFRDPSTGRLPAGTATSVYLFTTYGVRWADLGVIPTLSPDLLVGAERLMHSYCDSISNPWAGGITDLSWVDPLLDPDYDHQLELGRLRLWTLGLRNLPEIARIELLAIAPGGRERLLGVVEGRRDIALELVTDANETLAMRTERAFTAPAPTLSRSWLYPASDVEMEPKARSAPAVDAALAERIVGAMADQEARGRLPWATAIRLRRQTLAVPHRGGIVVGTVVRRQRVQ